MDTTHRKPPRHAGPPDGGRPTPEHRPEPALAGRRVPVSWTPDRRPVPVRRAPKRRRSA